jgi:hypothetical protein
MLQVFRVHLLRPADLQYLVLHQFHLYHLDHLVQQIHLYLQHLPVLEVLLGQQVEVLILDLDR